jgi:hypothetical protein
MIFIPAYWLQLIDCADEHDPCMGLLLQGAENVPPMPNGGGGNMAFLSHFQSIPNGSTAEMTYGIPQIIMFLF